MGLSGRIGEQPGVSWKERSPILAGMQYGTTDTTSGGTTTMQRPTWCIPPRRYRVGLVLTSVLLLGAVSVWVLTIPARTLPSSRRCARPTPAGRRRQ